MARDRLHGLDIARALAIAGMVVVNLDVSLGAAERTPGLLAELAGLLRGRAAATFVVLAGVGMSLLSAGARRGGDAVERRSLRLLLLRRGAFLLLLGLMLMALGWWPDILHYYAFYLGFAATLLFASGRLLAVAAGGALALFYAFVPFYERGWATEGLEYTDLWTPLGFTHNLLFNGLHPVFPWVVFVAWGLWLGRQDLRSSRVQGAMVLGGAAVAAATEAVSGLLVGAVGEELAPLVWTQPMPPGAPYLLAGGGVATALVGASLAATQRWPDAPWGWVVPFGQHALTWYVGHVLLLVVPLAVLGAESWAGMGLVWGVSAAFVVIGAGFSAWWGRRHRRGPLSAWMRRVTG